MNLEQQLKQAAEPWLAEENLSQEQADTLAALVGARSLERADDATVAQAGARSRERADDAPVGAQSRQGRPRPRFWWAPRAAAAAAAVLLVTVPVVTGMASSLPIIGPFVSRFAFFDKGTEWALQQRYIAPVGEQSTDQGYTLRVEGVMADAARTKVFWTIEGPNLTPGTQVEFHSTVGSQSTWNTTIVDETLVDGRLVGSTTMGALPGTKAYVTLRLAEVAGVKGNWSVSFEASRAALDALARRVETRQQVQGDGWALTVDEVLFAPTETVVKVKTTGTAELEVLSARLLADGAKVPLHVVDGVQEEDGQSNLRFDRLEQPANLTLQIDELVRVEQGGPVLDLTQPGATVEAEGSILKLRSIASENGKTTVTLDVTGSDPYLIHRVRYWRLVGPAGTWLNEASREVPKDGREMVLTFEGEMQSPVKLEARQTLKTVARDLTVTLPTK